MRLGLTPREWFLPTEKPNPIDDIREALQRATRGLSVFGYAGPMPVRLTLASAALNRGESPPIMGNLRFTFAPDGAR